VDAADLRAVERRQGHGARLRGGDGEIGELPLSATSCPDWVLPNDGELGYYRALPEGKLLGQPPRTMRSR